MIDLLYDEAVSNFGIQILMTTVAKCLMNQAAVLPSEGEDQMDITVFSIDKDEINIVVNGILYVLKARNVGRP